MANKILLKDFNSPGYLLHPSASDSRLFIRNIIFTESFFVELTKTLIEKKGDDGKQMLYTAGKQYGYRFAVLNRYPKGNVNKVTIRPLWDLHKSLAHMEEIITHHVDPQLKLAEIEIEDLIVASKSELWYSPVSVGAGLWCYLNGDYSLESSAKKSAKGKYILLLGPREILAEKGFEVIESDKIPRNFDNSEYMLHNQSMMKLGNNFTLKKLIEDKEIILRKGSMYLSNSEDRIFILELSRMYGLEELIDEGFIIEASHKSFYDIGLYNKSPKDPYNRLSEFLTAFGFGLVYILKDKDKILITFNGYPWFPPKPENTSFAYIKGAITGFLDGATGKKHKIESVSPKMEGNVFVVSVEVKQY